MFELHSRLQADTRWLGDLPLCRVLLAKDSQYPWLILVPRVANLREIHHLAPEQQQQLMQESCAVAALMEQALSPDKINIGATTPPSPCRPLCGGSRLARPHLGSSSGLAL